MTVGTHQGFSLNEKQFTPVICEQDKIDPSCNASLVKLTADPNADLKWDEELKKAEERTGLIFWQIDLGLEKGPLHLKDSSHFLSLSIALEKFSQEIWPKFKEKTLGVGLYKGVFDLPERLVWNQSTQELFEEYLAENLSSVADEKLQRLFFVADLFAEFMHRLISYLPTECAAFALFDPEKIADLAIQACLFSPTRFEHLHLALKNCMLPLRGLNWQAGKALGGWVGEEKGGSQKAEGRSEEGNFATTEITHALLIPLDHACSPAVLQKLGELLSHLENANIPYRIIPESLLTEEWDGIETLYILPEAVSSQGRRMLQGFEIAGGEVVERIKAKG